MRKLCNSIKKKIPFFQVVKAIRKNNNLKNGVKTRTKYVPIENVI